MSDQIRVPGREAPAIQPQALRDPMVQIPQAEYRDLLNRRAITDTVTQALTRKTAEVEQLRRALRSTGEAASTMSSDRLRLEAAFTRDLARQVEQIADDNERLREMLAVCVERVRVLEDHRQPSIPACPCGSAAERVIRLNNGSLLPLCEPCFKSQERPESLESSQPLDETLTSLAQASSASQPDDSRQRLEDLRQALDDLGTGACSGVEALATFRRLLADV